MTKAHGYSRAVELKSHNLKRDLIIRHSLPDLKGKRKALISMELNTFKAGNIKGKYAS